MISWSPDTPTEKLKYIQPEAEPVNDGDGKTDIGNGDITDNNNGEQVQYSIVNFSLRENYVKS